MKNSREFRKHFCVFCAPKFELRNASRNSQRHISFVMSHGPTPKKATTSKKTTKVEAIDDNDRPLPLITVDPETKQFVLNPEGLQALRAIKNNLAVVVVAGKYRYVNFFLHYLQSAKGNPTFATAYLVANMASTLVQLFNHVPRVSTFGASLFQSNAKMVRR